MTTVDHIDEGQDGFVRSPDPDQPAGGAMADEAGNLAGRSYDETFTPANEHDYWRANFVRSPYVTKGATYEDFGPAYQYGWESYRAYPNRSYDEVESSLESKWDNVRGKSKLTWERAKAAVRDGWDRVAHRKPKMD